MATLTRSPLAPERFPVLSPIPGVRLAAVAAGIKYKQRADVLLGAFDAGTTVAGVLTKSAAPGAPVVWCREILPGGSARGLVVNSGNANVFNGAAGVRAVEETAVAAAKVLGCSPREGFLASTGVIGEPLPHDRILAKLEEAAGALSADAWAEAAGAIMTTDTFPKACTRTTEIGGTPVTITGIAKGSGMIQPDMATMLSFVATDAVLPAPVAQALLSRLVDRTFNCITVDSDTSTSDTLMLFATGKAGNAAPTDANARELRPFAKALEELLHDLALQVVRDGEGAQKLIRVDVSGATSRQAAKRIGLSIANSPLVKTAIAGEDANWGRIVMAVGKAGEKADRDRMSVAFGGIAIASQGRRVDGYDEAPVTAHMKGREILIEVDVGVGRGKATVWTCDLTHGYISINADYRS